MDLKTIGVIVRVFGPTGHGVYQAPVVAQLSRSVVYNGTIVPQTIVGETDEYGMCVLRLWPNSLLSPADGGEYKFTITNPEGGRKIYYARLPTHDCFLEDFSGENSGDWVDGGIGTPGSGSNTGTIGAGATITIGTTTAGPIGSLPAAFNRGDEHNRIVDFRFPLPRDGEPGKNGLNGTGTIEVVETITGAPGTPALVENVGTPERQLLRVTIPQGIPGNTVIIREPTDPGTGTGTGPVVSPLPDGGIEGQLLVKVGTERGVSTWRTFDLSSTAATFIDSYPWEAEAPVDPTPVDPGTPQADPGLGILDATLLAAYRAAIAGTASNKRQAAAQAIIVAMGTAQRLTLRRNGVDVLVANYTGAMPVYSDALNVGVSFASLQSVTPNPLPDADVNTGTWTGELAGGANFARKITLPLKTNFSTAPGMGFNPSKPLILPRSIDGL